VATLLAHATTAYDHGMMGTGAGLGGHGPWGRSTVIAPASVAGGLALVLGTVGYSLVGFAIATSCTDVHTNLHGCDAMYRWMNAGRLGQWVLVLPVIAMLLVGLARPASRKVLAVSAWTLAALAPVWFVFYMFSANQAF
jgi:hypothetical protein